MSWDKKWGFYSRSGEKVLEDWSDILLFTFQKDSLGRGVESGLSEKGQERRQSLKGAF